MRKIVIHYEDDIDTNDVLGFVFRVASRGRISQSGPWKQFCFVTHFGSEQDGVLVLASINKTGTTDAFKVYKKRHDVSLIKSE